MSSLEFKCLSCAVVIVRFLHALLKIESLIASFRLYTIYPAANSFLESCSSSFCLYLIDFKTSLKNACAEYRRGCVHGCGSRRSLICCGPLEFIDGVFIRVH